MDIPSTVPIAVKVVGRLVDSTWFNWGGDASRQPTKAPITRAHHEMGQSRPRTCTNLLVAIPRTVEGNHDCFLGMEAILCLVENNGLRTITHLRTYFLASMGGEAVHK